MYLLFLLIALISTTDFAQGVKTTRYNVPRSTIPDGTLITFYFLHTGANETEEERVEMKFADGRSSHAFLRVSRKLESPVFTSTNLGGRYSMQGNEKQILDQIPPSNGWWRVDFHKFDDTRANVCFQGFWSQVRTFGIPLTNIEYIDIESDFVDHSKLLIVMNLKNDNLPLVNFISFMNVIIVQNEIMKKSKEERFTPKAYAAFPKFPVGAHMEITAWLRASGDRKELWPSLMFVEHGSRTTQNIFEIAQHWEKDTNELVMISKHRKTVCTKEKPNGDLQHLYLERTTEKKIKLRVLYKNGIAGIFCEHEVPNYTLLDKPIEILGAYGGFPLFITHSIPKA